MDQTHAVMPTQTRPTIAVLRFQLGGCAYQPPAGDQTCLGYLGAVSEGAGEALAGGAYGIFPPPPIVKCRCGDIWGWV